MWPQLALMAGSGLAEAFKGDSEREKLYRKLMSVYNSDEFGMSDVEKSKMQQRFNEFISQDSADKASQFIGSAGRRGMLSAGSFGNISTEIGTAGIKAGAQGMRDIELQDMQDKRQGKDRVLQALTGLSQGDEGGDLAGNLGEIAGLLTQYESNKKLFNPKNPGKDPYELLYDWTA